MSNYKKGGYEKKYIISKANGNLTDAKADYFVLRLDKDPHALLALSAYANSVQKDNIELATDLWKKINEYGENNLFDETSDKPKALNIVDVSVAERKDCETCFHQFSDFNKCSGCAPGYIKWRSKQI